METQKIGYHLESGKYLLNNNNAKSEVQEKEALLLITGLDYNIEEKYIAQTSKY